MPLITFDELTPLQAGKGSIRENLLDFIEILSPKDTPLYNNLGSIKVEAGYVEYLEDVLASAAVNAWPEGVAASDQTLVTPTRNSSIVQNFQKHFQVSNRQLAVTHAGMGSMLNFQEMKRAKELKNDLELALHRGSAVTGNSNVAPQFRGLLNIASTNFTASSGTTFTERVFNDQLVNTFNNPVNLRECYVNMLLKRTINQYSSSVTRFLPASDRRQVEIIDVYESEVGVLAMFKSRYQLQATSVTTQGNSFSVIDPDYFQVGWLRPINTYTLGIDGDRTRRMMVGEMTLIARSEKALVAGTGFVAKLA